jgi:hypothetical protein
MAQSAATAMRSPKDRHPGEQYVCLCRLNTDLFINSVDKYFDYDGVDDDKFLAHYGQHEDYKHLAGPRLKEILEEEVKPEREGRIRKYQLASKIGRYIAVQYKPLHPELRQLNEEQLDPKFLETVGKCRNLLRERALNITEKLRASGGVIKVEDGLSEENLLSPYFSRGQLEDAGFTTYIPADREGDLLNGRRPTAGVTALPNVFTKEFREKLTAELINFSQFKVMNLETNEEEFMPYTRPNNMNRNGGVLLYELGFQPFLDELLADYLEPVLKVAVPDDFVEVPIDGKSEIGFHDLENLIEWDTPLLDAHKVFTVAYQSQDYPDQHPETGRWQTTLRRDLKDSTASGGHGNKTLLPYDEALSVHTDNGEATINLHLAGDWTGGDLHMFGKLGPDENYNKAVTTIKASGADGTRFTRSGQDSLGLAVMHTGSEFHAAGPVNSGFRLNLVFWLRSSKFRNRRCPMCLTNAPVSLVRIGDGDLGGEGYSQGLEVGQISTDNGFVLHVEPKVAGLSGSRSCANSQN